MPVRSSAAAMRAVLRVAVPAVLMPVLLAGCAGSQAGGGPGGSDNRFVAGDGAAQLIKAADRKSAPAAAGSALDGRPLDLAGLRGKVVVVNFWASWCAPCRGEAPTLARLHAQHRANGVEFVGIDIRDSRDPARAMERNFKIGYPSLFDADGRLTLAFKDVPPNAIPSTLVLDRQGRVAARIIGATTYSGLNPMIQQIAAER